MARHDPRRIAVLISGRGSNMQALVEAADGYDVVLVASNKPQAAGIDWARAEMIATWVWNSRQVERAAFEAELTRALEAHGVGTIALAGFMRLLSPGFVERWQGRIVNIHPSLLPTYPGLDTHQRALDAGDKVHGCTVHVVTDRLDDGPILAREEVPVEPGDTATTLEARVLAAEHRLYPRALADFVMASRRD